MRATLLGSTIWVSVSLLAGQAQAQTAGSPAAVVPAQADAPADQPDIVVTGSLIRGSREDAPAPVDVIGAQDLARQGSPSIVELMKALPTSSGVLGDSNQFDSRSQGSEGIATVNLRGLTPERTLVLLNSKRLVPVGTGAPAVDINLIPLAAIGRVEVLKDGAAATYGSDAIAGVVNFFTRTDQKGFRAAGSYKHVPGSDGDIDASISFGHDANGLRFLVAAGVQTRGQLLATQRDFALRDYATNPQGGWNPASNPGSFVPIGATGAPLGAVRTDVACAPLGGYVTTQNRCIGNTTQFDALAEQERRGQVFVDVGIDLPHGMEVQATALYGASENPHVLTSPSYLPSQPPSIVALGGVNRSSVSGFYVPASNPGFQAYAQQNGGLANAAGVVFPTLLFRPYLLGGNPLTLGEADYPGSLTGSRRSETARFTLALRGPVTQGVDFEIAGTYQHYYRYVESNDIFGDRIQLALRGLGGAGCNVAANTPGQNGCQYLNPFGNAIAANPVTGAANPGYVAGVANTASLASWLFVPSVTRTNTQLFVADATVSGGTGISLPGGELKFALGGQYRRSSFRTALGAANDLAVTPCRETPLNGNLGACAPSTVGGPAAQATGAFGFLGSTRAAQASSDVRAVFAELQLPILSSLNGQLSARYEDYGGQIGSTFNPQARLRFQATDWLAFRGGIGTTFRGPPVQYLTPNSFTGLQLVGSAFKPVEILGRPGLQPETSTNLSGGVLFNAGGLRASVDYFRYQIRDTIVADPLGGMVATLFAGSNCTNAAYAALRQRFFFNDGGGVAGAGTCSAANVSRVVTTYQNGARVRDAGLDFNLDYDADVGAVRVSMGGSATYNLEYKTGAQSVAGVVVQPAFDAAGKLNYQTTAYPVPRWKGQAYVQARYAGLNARVTFNYVGGMYDQRADDPAGIFGPSTLLPGSPTLSQGSRIAPFRTADVSLQYQIVPDTNLTLTVLNVTDRDPPFARLNYNYDPFTASALGRQVKLGVSTAF
ncbi:TonB-dependent receptor [uncultured Sphingomonas sp.]|uniref:TonB-dependent receptor domain-containing protein n=1 Tax=uncultured Sphingomonas sp. TaxID=158754 RepID=UPI0025EF4A6B|nr:TonB-dependent receptor [uncultured Sphingomonas sp.]